MAKLRRRAMADSKRVVYIIDDDPSVLKGFTRLIAAYGYDARGFGSAREFLAAGLPGPDSCLIIDVAMPEMNGLQLQEKLVRAGCQAPVIFITALNDPDIRERAKQTGAVGFFQKPVDAEALLDAVKWALTDGGKEEGGTGKSKEGRIAHETRE
jgi:FixJ family two-component response regulator